MKVKACVLTYRESEMATACLQSIPLQNRELVFNGSDGAAEDQFAIPGVSVISEPENLPFAEVVNRAVDRCGDYDALLFATNDVTFAENSVERLIDLLDANPAFGLLGPLQTVPDFTDWHHVGGGFDRRRWAAEVLNDEPIPALPIVERDWIDGGAMLIRREAFHAVGGMRPEYGFYWEDVDFGLKLGAAGSKVGVATDCWASHKSSPTTGRTRRWKAYILARNRALSARLNLAPGDFAKTGAYLKRSALWKLARKFGRERERIYYAGILDGLDGDLSLNKPVADDDPVWNQKLRL